MNCLIENEYIKGKKRGKKNEKKHGKKKRNKSGEKKAYFIAGGGLLFFSGSWRTLFRVVY